MSRKSQPKQEPKRSDDLQNQTMTVRDCFVGQFHEIEKDSIRQGVCQSLPADQFVVNDHYCILHAPTQSKDLEEFNRIVNEKITRRESHFEAIVFPGSFRLDHGNPYDLPMNFRYAQFLSSVELHKIKTKYLYFDHCVFHGFTHFNSVLIQELATFDSAVFKREAWFSGSHFGRSDFSNAIFQGSTRFNMGATFNNTADFTSARFESSTDFSSAIFRDSVWFNEAVFPDKSNISFVWSEFETLVSFKKAIFEGYVSFDGTESRPVFGKDAVLDLQKAQLERPERLSFHTVRLQPNWFVNANARKLVFTNCHWKDQYNKNVNTESELECLVQTVANYDKITAGSPQQRIDPSTSNPNKLLTQTCWQLADNYEKSKGFSDASVFRRIAFESERLDRKARIKKWYKRLADILKGDVECEAATAGILGRTRQIFELFESKNRPYDLVHSLYHHLSGYGEKWFRAFCWLLLIWIFFAVLYWLTGSFIFLENQPPMDFGHAIGYSLQVMALRTPEPRPYGASTIILYGVETILSPVVAALLALAIRRKFMR